jgi:Rrf2 family protein
MRVAFTLMSNLATDPNRRPAGRAQALQLPAKAHYACLAMLELARRAEVGTQPVAVREIAERHAIPAAFLTQILQQLRAAGLVASSRGKQGGFRLARAAERITLADVCGAVVGSADEPAGVDSSTVEARVLNDAWRRAAKAQQNVLAKLVLADLARRCRTSDPAMYDI